MSTKKITQTLDKLEKSLSKSKTHATNVQLLSSVSKTLITEKDAHLSETLEKSLNDAFTIQIEPLYGLKPAEALNVAAAVMNYLFERKVRAQLSKKAKVGAEEMPISDILRWQRIIDRGILSGILNHFGASSANKDLIGISTYPALLNILKSDVWASLDYALKNKVLGLLVDTSQGCPKNKSILTNRNILSASDLARLITLTYEYVVMDPLMELVARLLPSLNHNKERGDFIHGIFRSEIMEKAFSESAAAGLGRLFNSARGDISENTLQSIRLMGERDQRRPQAFGAKNITANGVLFVQPSPYHVFVDKIGFVADVGSEEEGVETLIVTFETIQAIHFVRDSQDGLRILITLFSPPLLQYRSMDKPVQSPNRETLGSSLLFDMKPGENMALRLTLAAHGMQSKIFDSSTPASAKKHPRASQTAAPIDLIGPVSAGMTVSGNASDIRAKEREMAKTLSSPIEEYSESDKSFKGITKLDPFPLVAESGTATAEKSSKRPPKPSPQELVAITPVNDVFGNDSGSDLSDPPSVLECVRESSVHLEEKLSPPSSPSPATQTGAPPTNWKRMENLSRTSASAKANTRSAQKRSAGADNEETIVKKPRTNKSHAAYTGPKLLASPRRSLRSARKTYKGSHKKPGRLPASPVPSEQPSIDFDIIPNPEARPNMPGVQHPSSSHRSPIISETEIFPSDGDLVLEPAPVPKKRGRASRIIDEDARDGVLKADSSRTSGAKVTLVEKSSKVTEPGVAESVSGSKASTVKLSPKQSPVVGKSTLKEEVTPSVHAHMKGTMNNAVHTNPLKTPEKKHRKAPWEQPNFLPPDSLDDVNIQLRSGPDTMAQSNLVSHANEDHRKGYGEAATSDPVNFDEALKTSTPAKYPMPESPAPTRIGSQQGRSMSHVSRSTKHSVGFGTYKQSKNHPASEGLPAAKGDIRSASIVKGEPSRDEKAPKERLAERSMDDAFGPSAETKNERDNRDRYLERASIDNKAKEAANQVIDLTSDLEIPSAGQPHTRRSFLNNATTPTPVKSALKTQAGARPRHSVSFAASTTLHSPVRAPAPKVRPLGPKAQLRLDEEQLPASVHKASKTAPTAKNNSVGLPDNDENWVSNVSSILNQICDRLVETKQRKFKGIRQNVLTARNEILEAVQDDLRHCLAVSIEHYNGFLELNSQYEAAERTVQNAYDELGHVNAAISEKLHEVIKDHDRLSLCKGMTTSLKRTGSKKAIGATFEKLGVYLDTA